MKKNEFRKELVLILVLLCTTIAYAQKNDSSFMVAPADSTKDISLTQRVDSLEHELSYIKLSYELYTLNNDLSIFNNDIGVRTNAIQINIYISFFIVALSSIVYIGLSLYMSLVTII